MPLSFYHQKHVNQSDSEIQNKVDEKKRELATIFAQVPMGTTDTTASVAILGCGDKRFVKQHKKIFADFITKPVQITTYDITIDHLKGEENIVQHDCTRPLPNGPFDITYAHVLLRFIETEKQWDLLINSYNALKPNGLAIHLLDKEDYETKETKLANGLFSVPLNRWKIKLDTLNITYKEIPVTYGLALVILQK